MQKLAFLVALVTLSLAALGCPDPSNYMNLGF